MRHYGQLKPEIFKLSQVLSEGMTKVKTVQSIVKKHHIKNENSLMDELKKGIEVEKEHTTNKKEAVKIALDHLYEDPKYYTKLSSLNL
jgi:hypothetical protein